MSKGFTQLTRCAGAMGPALALMGALFVSPASFAANVCSDPAAFIKPPSDEEPKNTLMDERVFKRLSAAHEALGESRYEDVFKALRVLQANRLNDFEQAQVNQTYGFAYAQQGKYNESIPYFEKALALNILPKQAQQGMLYSLAGLYATNQNHRKTISTLERWFPDSEDPPGDAFIMMASSYAELNDYPNALPCVRQAIERTAEPKESWYQLELAIHFEQENYTAASTLLRKVVAIWPDKLTYWEMLSGAYRQENPPKDQESLSVLKLAYYRGLLETEPKLLNLVRIMLFNQLPYEAGKMLADEIQKGRIAGSEKNLDLLLTAWTQAKNFTAAVSVIDQLAPLKGNGQLFLQKAQIYNERNDWSNVVSSCDQALAGGGLTKPGVAYVLKGMALAELGQFDDALATLESAKGFDDSSRRQATGWIEFVNDRKRIL